MVATPILGFLDEDKEGTFQPHDDALVVTIRIDGYDAKRVLVYQRSGTKIMYPDLYKGLNLKPKDLQVSFIVVEAYSLYTAILAGPWLHAIRAVLLTLHLKVKYPTQGRVRKLVGSQVMARQCLIVVITRQLAGQAVVEDEQIP